MESHQAKLGISATHAELRQGLLEQNLKGFGPDKGGGTDSFTYLGSAGTALCWCF